MNKKTLKRVGLTTLSTSILLSGANDLTGDIVEAKGDSAVDFFDRQTTPLKTIQ